MNKKLKLNTVSSLVYEIVAIISGFILPRLIIGRYGSDINGLVNSITQFIGVISFLDLGVGKVVQSSLYKPLAKKDNDQISRVMVSGRNFFRKLVLIMFLYVLVLLFVYPFISGNQFGWLYTSSLIVAMSISSLAQYYFGVTERLLLTADQKGYIQYTAQALTLIMNTAACAVLINLGFGIHAVKLVTSLIFIIRPVFLSWYVSKNYHVNYAIRYDTEPISQKWNGMAQHIAYVVLNNTDIIVLTIFGSYSSVSVYSVYHLVVYGVKRLFTSMTNGIEALLGELWAREDRHRLAAVFGWTEWVIHTGVVLIFGCTACLILPFVRVYTNGITDAEYIQPLFAVLIVMAHGLHCMRLPYNLMIFAAGHYRQTQNNYITAAVMNIIISVVTVRMWGLVGVAIGTLVSMLFQTLWMAVYNAKNLVIRSMTPFIKQIFVDIFTIILMMIASRVIEMKGISYVSWFFCSVRCFLLFTGISAFVNIVFYREFLMLFFNRIKSRVY